jgi:Tc toxin complex TcA C-terminal TcB-binding domain/Salmonella virulence plasmid 65kDa B protein
MTATDPAGPAIAVPQGGGALQGVGEKFSPDLHTGTGNLSVPIAVPPGRRGHQPQLALTYSSGSGNGPCGIGSFLTTKSFANEALYEWMAGVIEGVYRFFLQQATQLARLAELQLAFQRQETPQGFIKRGYWDRIRFDSSPDVASLSNSSDSVRGLTGAANLLRDIYQLDQYAFLKNKRKQQLTETVSMVRLDPLAFAQLGDTGRIVFETPMDLFDSRFPGHYLRLINRVRVSVVALIPPNVGIRATLSNSGVSSVTIADGDGGFDTVTLQRGFEQVAYTVPIDANGQFAVDVQPDLLNAFEGSGVATRWVFDLPRAANPFDFDSIADILVTFEYTALYDSTLRAKVIAAMPTTQPGERVFSMRFEFPDAWYDLFNAQPTDPLAALFTTSLSDFPPNLSNIRITNLVLQVRFTDAVSAMSVSSLSFTPQGRALLDGGAATLDSSGVVSTRSASGNGWLAITNGAATADPVGEWRLQFSDAARALFAGNAIDDVLLAVSFAGTPPPWP